VSQIFLICISESPVDVPGGTVLLSYYEMWDLSGRLSVGIDDKIAVGGRMPFVRKGMIIGTPGLFRG
jgi:hypothetical protein